MHPKNLMLPYYHFMLLSGHFLLTTLLLDDLIKYAADNGESRVVIVGSRLHDITDAKKLARGRHGKYNYIYRVSHKKVSPS